MEKIVYFDYCAFILLLVLLITTIYRKMVRGKLNHFFLLVIVVTLIAATADVCALNLDRLGAGNVLAKHIAHSVYLLAHNSTIPFYIIYLFAITDTWHVLHQKRWLSIGVALPYAVMLIFMVSNPFTNFIYYLNGNDAYTRGSGFIFLYVLSAFYVLYGFLYLWRFRTLFSGPRFYILLSMFPLMMIVAAIQFFFPRMVLELFVGAIALTYISMMVQRPEELVDSETGLFKLSAYVRSMQNSSITKKPMEIIMLNIINYQVVFDMLGYDNMNRLLRSIANQLNALNKNRHTYAELYYLGQGKFRIVMDNRHFEQTAETALLVCRALKPGISLNQMEINLVAHVCIARYPEDISDIDALLAFGNDLNNRPYTGEVLYAADIFKKEHYDIMRDIDRIMEQALADRSFEVYYQPIYSVEEQRFNSAEALLRLKNEKYGFISPEIFIPAAEKNGAIHKIGAFVIDEVCRFISSEAFRDLGIDYIEVNLSVAQCMQSNLAKNILDTLDMYNVSPEQINLEITETAASYSQNAMMENLRELTSAGLSFSLDDYGTGYSNIRRIASLPLHLIKLDKSFTNIEDNPKMLVILENTIRMIKAMNMKIVVEGVETESMVEQFAALKCDYIQGYYYSRPIPQNEFVAFIQHAKI